ncbi:MAG: helix-turn-helix transcriptional regulator [Halobacteriales archaeon]
MGESKRERDIMKLLPVLETLQEESGLRQSEIRDATDYSKSTTHRRLKKATKMGLVTKSDGVYHLSELGELATKKASEYVSAVNRAYDLREFVRTVNDADLDITQVSDAKVTRSSVANPVAPLVRLAEVTVNASEVRVVTNSIAPESFEVGRAEIRDGSLEVEMVVDRRTVESIRGSNWFGEELERDLRTGNFDLWVHEDDVPYQIGVMDDKLCLGAEDENRMPVAMLETGDENAVEWGMQKFESYRDDAERIEPSDV